MPNNKQNPNGSHAKATTLQILGSTNHAPRIKPEWKAHYQLLMDLRAQLGQRKGGLNEIAREEQPAFSLHMADAGTDEFDRDFALSLMSSDQEALYELDQAISRIRNGTYGVCELTGATIEPDRLAALPWARFSMDAQKELELTGAVHRTQFGKRGSLTVSETSEEESEEETPAA